MKIASFKEKNLRYGAEKILVLVHVQHVENRLGADSSIALYAIKNWQIGVKNVVGFSKLGGQSALIVERIMDIQTLLRIPKNNQS